MSGRYTPGPKGAPERQKFIAVFPQALSLFRPFQGEWNTGFSPTNGGLSGVDDVAAIVACVEEADRLLGLAWTRLNPTAPPPSGPFFTAILVLGFSGGGTMAYRCASELPTRDTKWGVGALHPNTIAVAECASGGHPFAADTPWPFEVPTFPVPLVRWDPDLLVSSPWCNVLHLQSDQDRRSALEGGVAQAAREAVDTQLATAPGSASFYPWHLRMGPTLPTPAPQTFSPWIEGIGPWVDALPAGPVSASVSSTGLLGAPASVTVWTWDSVAVLAFRTGPVGWAVRFVLWSSQPGPDGDGHSWPDEDVDGFSATGEAWNFFFTHA